MLVQIGCEIVVRARPVKPVESNRSYRNSGQPKDLWSILVVDAKINNTMNKVHTGPDIYTPVYLNINDVVRSGKSCTYCGHFFRIEDILVRAECVRQRANDVAIVELY